MEKFKHYCPKGERFRAIYHPASEVGFVYVNGAYFFVGAGTGIIAVTKGSGLPGFNA